MVHGLLASGAGPRAQRSVGGSLRPLAAAFGIALLLVLAGCDPAGEQAPPPPAQWAVALEGLPGALLSVWTGDGVTYAVGADGGDGPVVVRHADGAWERLQTGATGDLWWVAPDHAGNLWMVGEAGLVLRHAIGSDSFTAVDAGTDATLFGIFFVDATHAWAAGGWVRDGTAGPGGERGVFLRFDGDGFATEPGVAAELLQGRALFKVWARAADDVWVVGERGVLLHSTGGAFASIATDVAGRLLTVHGSEDFGPIAVGGANNAALLELDSGAAVDRSLEVDEGFAPALNGVFVVDAQRSVVVGNAGFTAERDASGAFVLPELPPTQLHLHGVNVDAEGGVWAVGGDLLSHSFDEGLVLYRGHAEIGRGL